MKARLSVILFVFCSAGLCGSAVAQDDHAKVQDNYSTVVESIKQFSNNVVNTDKVLDAADKSDFKLSKDVKNRLDTYLKDNQDLVQDIKEVKEKSFDAAANGAEAVFSDKSVAKLVEDGKKIRENMNKAKEDHGIVDEFDTLIFISFGMSEDNLKQLYQMHAGNERVALVIRGLAKGDKGIPETLHRIQKIAVDLKLETPPTVLINPVWFRQYKITSVPTILVLKSKTPKRSGDIETGKENKAPDELARVEGLIDPQTVYQAIYDGKRGDLGIKGPVEEIQERDLIEEMQERASKIDWEEKRQKAIARTWQNIPIETLEHATENRVRVIDPTVTVQQDITADDPKHPGEKLVIARRGDKINPLALRVFDRVLFVFDPTNEQELEFMKTHHKEFLNKYKSAPNTIPKFLITSINRDKGWENLSKLSDTFDEPIFTLVPEIKKTFLLEKTPCVVYAKGQDFVVEEFDVNTKQK